MRILIMLMTATSVLAACGDDARQDVARGKDGPDAGVAAVHVGIIDDVAVIGRSRGEIGDVDRDRRGEVGRDGAAGGDRLDDPRTAPVACAAPTAGPRSGSCA